MTMRLTAAALPVALLLLTGCTTSSSVVPSDAETFVSASSAPEEPAALTPDPVEPDTTLIVSALATAANGATLTLELQVHKAVRWDDVANQTLPAALVTDCAGRLTADQFAAQSWSFTRATLTAIPASPEGAVWPSDARVDVLPSAATVYASGRGILTADGGAGALCEQPKSFSAAGHGGIAIGIPADTPAFTGWAQHRFELVVPAGAGVVLSNCSVELTALGESLLGDAAWAPADSATACGTGPASEKQEY